MPTHAGLIYLFIKVGARASKAFVFSRKMPPTKKFCMKKFVFFTKLCFLLHDVNSPIGMHVSYNDRFLVHIHKAARFSNCIILYFSPKTAQLQIAIGRHPKVYCRCSYNRKNLV